MLRQLIAMTLVVLTACGGDSTGPDGGDGGGGGGGATLTGTVRVAGQSVALPGATVSIGTHQATSDDKGHFELTSIPVGAATVRAERPGYEPATANITITAGTNTRDFGLTAQELYQLGAIAAYVPGGVEPLGGAIITLGGPLTSGFVTGKQISADGSDPVLEQALQDLGSNLRLLARTRRMALLGTSTSGMPNSAASDDALLAAVKTLGEQSGHPELVNGPVLMFGLSSGGPEASGLASRLPGRTIGVLVRVPVGVVDLRSAEALAVPTFVMQAERDDPARNTAVRGTFTDNRARGGLWSLAVEPGVIHSQATARANAACITWLGRVLDARLPSTPGGALAALDEESGWLGNQSTLDIATWADYADDRTAASWLINETIAKSWQQLGTVPTGGVRAGP